ncbi:major facilitator superfamily domain-containing protein [Aspergillus floccosus]
MQYMIDTQLSSREVARLRDNAGSTEKSFDVAPKTSCEIATVEQQANGVFASADQLGSTEPHVFSDPIRAAHWQNVYERVQYEGRSRFDPAFTWTASAERRVKMKVWVMFSSLDLARRNINRAISDNMLGDLNINTNDYNTGQVIFLVSFLAAELPGGLISKKVGPDRMTPISITLWGLVCACQSAIKTKTGFFVLRAVIGLLQGGFIPEMVLYLSYYYKSNELPIRLSIFWTAIPLTQIYGSLLASGLLQLRGVRGWGGWQWLFLIEGLLCIMIGIISGGIMPASVTEGALLFRRKDGSNAWWTEEEEKILVNRVLRDDPTKGDMNNRQAIIMRDLWKAMMNVDLWPIYLHLSLTLRNMNYSVFDANLLAIPGYVLFAINIVAAGWLSEKLKERSLVAALSNIWMLPFFIGLVCIKPSVSPWVRYILLTGVNGIPYTHSILVGMTSRNAKNVGTRAVSAAIYNMCYQIGSIIATNIYREEDKPYYYTANKALVGLCSANIALFFATKMFFIWRNKVHKAHYDALSPEEKVEAVDFRFAH